MLVDLTCTFPRPPGLCHRHRGARIYHICCSKQQLGLQTLRPTHTETLPSAAPCQLGGTKWDSRTHSLKGQTETCGPKRLSGSTPRALSLSGHQPSHPQQPLTTQPTLKHLCDLSWETKTCWPALLGWGERDRVAGLRAEEGGIAAAAEHPPRCQALPDVLGSPAKGQQSTQPSRRVPS